MPSTETEIENEPASSRSLATYFRERRLSVATMDRYLRVATVTAFVSLALTAIFVALRDIPAPQVYLGRSLAGVIEISSVDFAITLLLLSVGLGYMITAAELSRPIVAVPSVAVLLSVIGFYTGAFGSTSGAVGLINVLPNWAQWTSRALLVALVLVAIRFWLWQRGSQGKHERAVGHIVALSINTVVFAAYWVTLTIAAPSLGSASLIGPAVDVLLGSISLVLYPFLQAAAVDFGEWGQLIAQRIVSPVASTGRLKVALAMLFCAVLVVYALIRNRTHRSVWSSAELLSCARGVLLVLVVWAVLWLVGHSVKAHRCEWPETIGFAAVVSVCAIFSLVIVPLGGLLNGNFVARSPELVSDAGAFAPGADVVRVDGGSAVDANTTLSFSFLVPRTWKTTSSSAGAVSRGPQVSDRSEQVIAFAAPSGAASSLSDAAKQLKLVVSDERTVGPWQIADAHDPAQGTVGLLWMRSAPATTKAPAALYFLEEQQSGYPVAQTNRLFEAIGQSFRTSSEDLARPPLADTAEAELTHADRLAVWQTALGALFTAVALLVVGLRRHAPLRAKGAALFLLVAFLFYIDVNLVPLGHFLFGAGTHVAPIGEYPVLVGVGLVSIVGLVISHVRQRRRTGDHDTRLADGLIGLIGAIAALELIYRLYAQALAHSHVAVWAALILLAAVTWEVVMSGQSLTNTSSARVPRSTRVLGFLGYTVVLCAGVLFFSTQSTHSTKAVEPFFEPESITQTALFYFALPLFVVLFYLRLVSREETEAEPEAAETHRTEASV